MRGFRIGFLGAGNMGSAIIRGILDQSLAPRECINIHDPNPEAVSEFESAGFIIMNDEIELAKKSDVIFLCIKPQGFSALLDKLSGSDLAGKLFVTIAAGISTKFVKDGLKQNVKVIRVMPNAPMMLSKGASAIYIPEDIDKRESEFIISIFSKLGIVSLIDESQMNEIVCVNGSSPAYVYYFVDAMLQSAMSQGIDEKTAFDLICAVFEGSVEMLKSSGKTPKELIQMVCSPGGTTIESIDCFDKNNVYGIIDKAMRACTLRAHQLDMKSS